MEPRNLRHPIRPSDLSSKVSPVNFGPLTARHARALLRLFIVNYSFYGFLFLFLATVALKLWRAIVSISNKKGVSENPSGPISLSPSLRFRSAAHFYLFIYYYYYFFFWFSLKFLPPL
jgi:hypothetical protein